MKGNLPSRKRRIVLLALAAAHLGLVAGGGLMLDWGASAAGRAVAYYGHLTGANSPYTYFASEFGALPWATFEVRERSGRTTTDVLEAGVSREADFCTRCLLNPLLSFEGDWRTTVAASMAGKIAARHPGAEGVTMRVFSCALPAMEDYRKGARPRWVTLYEADFAVRAAAGTPRRDGGGR